jgi:hypothetical protein
MESVLRMGAWLVSLGVDIHSAGLRCGGAAWPERGTGGDADCRVTRGFATCLSRKDYRAPCRRDAVGSPGRSGPWGDVGGFTAEEGVTCGDLICLKIRLRGIASFRLSP